MIYDLRATSLVALPTNEVNSDNKIPMDVGYEATKMGCSHNLERHMFVKFEMKLIRSKPFLLRLLQKSLKIFEALYRLQ